jgi:hypothetical protein
MKLKDVNKMFRLNVLVEKSYLFYGSRIWSLCIEDEELKEFGTDLSKSAGVVKNSCSLRYYNRDLLFITDKFSFPSYRWPIRIRNRHIYNITINNNLILPEYLTEKH